MDFRALLDTPEYAFLRTNPRLGERIMLLGVSGSYGYGTNREGSDIDFRGVTLNLPSDLIYSGDKLNEIATAIPVDSGSLVSQRSADIQAIAFSLRLDSDISLKVFFTPVEGYTGAFMAAINYDEPKEIMRSNGRYCVTIPGIWAHRIGEPYTITVTTAAGDTFTGYFLQAAAQGKDIPDALRMAAQASAIAVSRPGAAAPPPAPRARTGRSCRHRPARGSPRWRRRRCRSSARR